LAPFTLWWPTSSCWRRQRACADTCMQNGPRAANSCCV
jgi:hypothetical protein